MNGSELLVCWIDPDYDRANASDGQSRYGAYVRDYARLFDPWQDAPDGVTTDPVEFAMAAFRVATGPIMGPGFVRWHPRVCGYGLDRNDFDGRLVVSVTLATAAPLRLPGWAWRGWERDLFDDRFLEPRTAARRPGLAGAALAARQRPAPSARPAPRIWPAEPGRRHHCGGGGGRVGQSHRRAGPGRCGGGRLMGPSSACLLCGRRIDRAERRWPAFALAGIFAHAGCCGGYATAPGAGGAGWSRPRERRRWWGERG